MEQPPREPSSGSPSSRPIPAWVKLGAFILSGLLFVTGLLMIFAPLPILFLRLKAGRSWAWLAAATNAALVGVVGGEASLAIYTVMVLSIALAMPELLLGRRSLATAGASTLAVMTVVAGLWVSGYAQLHKANPVAVVRSEATATLDLFLSRLSPEARDNLLGPDGDAEEWKRSVVVELPWRVVVFALILVWGNLAVLLRLNPGRLRERMGVDGSVLRRWKAPEILLWPSIAAGFFLVFEVPVASTVALNVFMVLMAVYAIQGLSILSFFFDVWNLRGVMRPLGFMMAVFFLLPLLVGLGFFDQWFDFRAKLRQS